MPRSSWILALALLTPGGCSDNLGPAPPDGGRVVRVAAESVAGPRTDRVGQRVAVSGSSILVGTDSGLFRFSTANAGRWSPVHGGYLTPDLIQRVGNISELEIGAQGDLIFFRGAVATLDALVVSSDGGEFFDRLDRPDALLTTVDAIGIAPAGRLGEGGAWLAVQGGRVFHRGLDSAAWEARLMPRAPVEVHDVAADSAGRIGVGVASPTAADFTVWVSQGPGEDFTASGLVLESRVLALAFPSTSPEPWVATAAGIRREAATVVSWPGTLVEHAALDGSGGDPDWALVGRRADGELALARGSGPAVVVTSQVVPAGDVADLDLSGDVVRVLFRDGSSWSAEGTVDPYGGVEVDLWSVATGSPGEGLAAGQFRTGEVYQGPVRDPDGFSTRGTPLRASAPRRMLFDPLVEDALFVASFGLYRSDPQSSIWEERNTGFFSYDPAFFAGPFPVSAFEILDDGSFWVGGVSGDGPYRSRDAGLSWLRVHEGLGEPGSYLQEFGLPLVSQVRGFAVDGAGAVWMGAFRGGAFRLDAASDRWEQQSAGLPRVDGSIHDSCCPVPGESEVDVRDLVATEDGALLAATGWGIYRLPAGASRWEPRSVGLFNQDVQELLRHPGDSATVVAATRGRKDAPDWLYFTEDAGRTWFPVRGRLVGRNPIDLAWSDPARLEIVVLMEAQGVWRMELSP